MRAPAGIELLSDGTWDCGSTGGEWSPGGCGCGSNGSCGCGGSCGGCGGDGGCGGKSTGGAGEAPRLADYDGEIWASSLRTTTDRASGGQPSACVPGFCYVGGARRDGFLKAPNLVCYDQECLECETCQTTTATPVPWTPPPPPPPPPPPQKQCPEVCLQAAEQVEACLSALKGVTDPLQYNYYLAMCRVAAEWYEAICGGIPGCPSFKIPDGKKICGPDVTDWLVDQINKNKKDMWDNHTWFTFCDPWFFRDMAQAGGPWDFKNTVDFKVNKGGGDMRPQDCDGTVTLCGLCLNKDVPGNIHYAALGATCFGVDAVWYGSEIAERGQSPGVWDIMFGPGGQNVDPEWDQQALAAGIVITGRYMTDKVTKDALCKQVKARADKLNKAGTAGCSTCSVKF